jgi:DNA-binding winged helix-turn-helix (wHTH) protein/TolB-like protein/Tfp pilus assembly protein PilF
MGGKPKHFYHFGSFHLEAQGRALFQGSSPVHLPPKAVSLLLELVQNHGEIVEKEELMRTVWPDSFVEEANLSYNVHQIRKTLGSNLDEFIVTVPKRGYRFIAEVSETWDGKPHQQETKEAAAAPPAHEVAASPGRGVVGEPRVPAGGVRLRLTLAYGLVAVSVVALFVAIVRPRPELPVPAETPRMESLAILPLENISGDRQHDHWADGMTDALTTRLAQIKSLRVISRTSVMQYKNARKPLPEIARALQVDGIIEGSFERVEDRARIRIQLLHGPSDRHLYAREFECAITDVATLPGEIAQAIAREIHLELSAEEKARVAVRRPVNWEAYELVLKGRFFLNKRDFESASKALHYFQQALRKDPGYAPAHVGVADYYILGFYDSPNTKFELEARAALAKALELDKDLAAAHASLALFKEIYEWDWDGAIAEYRYAIALNPNDANVRWGLSKTLTNIGKFQEAVNQLHLARRLDPLSIPNHLGLALVHFVRRDYDRAIEESRKILEMDPNYANAIALIADSLWLKGHFPQAVREYQEFYARWIVPGGSLPDLEDVYRQGGKDACLRILIAELRKQDRLPVLQAQMYAYLGEKDEAFLCLKRSAEHRDPGVTAVAINPWFDNLRSDRRFMQLLQRMNLSR